MQELENNTEEIEIDLLDLAGYLLRKSWMIILTGVIFAAAGFVFSAFILVPQYVSTTGIYILNKQDGSAVSLSDTQLATQLIKDYKELITCRSVLEAVNEACGLNETYENLKERVTVTNATDTRIIYISVKDSNPRMAQYIADSIREIASEHIKYVTAVEAVNVVDQANLPMKPSEPSKRKWTAIAFLVGLVLCGGILVLIYLLDDTIKTADDVEKYLGLSTLAMIPMMQNESKGKKNKKGKIDQNRRNHAPARSQEQRKRPAVERRDSDDDVIVRAIDDLDSYGEVDAYGTGESDTYGVGAGDTYGVGEVDTYGVGAGDTYGTGADDAYGMGRDTRTEVVRRQAPSSGNGRGQMPDEDEDIYIVNLRDM